MEVPRCFKPPDFAGLHHFSDASQTGYEHTSCLRGVDVDGRMHGSLVMGESRVSPLKLVTMPRRELTATTVSVKVASMQDAELQYNNLSSTYWMDGRVVLGYVDNRCFTTNRVLLPIGISRQWRI